MNINIKKVHNDAIVPEYQTEGSVGFDLHVIQSYWIRANETVLLETGIAFEIPLGYELQIRLRSGTAVKTKLRLSNGVGTIDSDYRDSVKLIVENTGSDDEFIEKHTRLAQGIIAPIIKATFSLVDELSETDRNKGGFGSTGIK